MKIVITGPSQSGKSSYIKYLDTNSLNVDVGGKTVAMDVGFYKLKNFHITLFGTPGLLRFDVMRKIIASGADGIVFIFDAANSEKDKDAQLILEGLGKIKVPIIFLANKQDLKEARSPEEIRIQNKLSTTSKFFPASTKTGMNIKESIEYLVKTVLIKYQKLLIILRQYEKNIRGLADKLNKNKSQMRDFLNALEVRKFIEIDRIKKTYRVREGLKI